MPLGDAVYSALRDAITANIVPQATRLSGASLAASLGISRTPLRDALRRLEAEHLVASSPGSGFVVVPLSLEDIDEIYAIRAALEGCTASLAARHRTPSDLALLEAIHNAFTDAVRAEDVDSTAHLNARFHDAISQAAKGERLAGITSLLQQSVRRLGPTTLASRDRAVESVREHEAILAAIRDGNAAQAEAIAREHMERAHIQRVLQYQREYISVPAVPGAPGEIPPSTLAV
ncbi:MAG TPA: GntR family transcriptional regulator [Chloroflexota bacterium]|nr:GntR family transcriptional regulator [Chloroflexota bacterium]